MQGPTTKYWVECREFCGRVGEGRIKDSEGNSTRRPTEPHNQDPEGPVETKAPRTMHGRDER